MPSRTARAVRLVSMTALAGIVATGCAATGDKGAVRSAAAGFFDAVDDGDGERACAGLVPRARSGLETAGATCAEEITTLGLRGGRLGDAEIWGDQARIRAGDDTVFLTRWAGAWKVTAAGCRPRTGEPYDCEVEG